MKVAKVFSENSYCERKKVGAVIVKGNNIISYGWNGTPTGEDNVCEVDGITKPNVIHAETNAIYKLAKSNENSDGAKIYTTLSPCFNCALAIIQSGIKELYYLELYNDGKVVDYLKEKGIKVEQILNI